MHSAKRKKPDSKAKYRMTPLIAFWKRQNHSDGEQSHGYRRLRFTEALTPKGSRPQIILGGPEEETVLCLYCSDNNVILFVKILRIVCQKSIFYCMYF